jgi:hypothetical protein
VDPPGAQGQGMHRPRAGISNLVACQTAIAHCPHPDYPLRFPHRR